MDASADILRSHGIHPSAQRVAVARYVLSTSDHPSADEVFTRVRRKFPMLSRATVYNTLNLFVAKGLLRQFVLTGGRVVFDPNLDRHHHFIDLDSGRIHDVPCESLRVSDVKTFEGFDVTDYQVVMRGRRSPQPERSASEASRGASAAGVGPRGTDWSPQPERSAPRTAVSPSGGRAQRVPERERAERRARRALNDESRGGGAPRH
jgi:Fur family iron response transcriptional regulator